MHHTFGRSIAALGVVVLATAACGNSSKGSSSTPTSSGGTSGNSASAPGITTNSVSIGFISSTTGIAAPEFLGYPKGAQARFDLQNAEGGVNGRKINMVVANDAGSITQDLTAAQELASRDSFAIIPGTPFFFGAYRYLVQQDIPVVGSGFDGPEWGQQPNTNLFSTTDPFDAHLPQYTGLANFVKQHGGSNLACLGYGISPSSSSAAKGCHLSAMHEGLRSGYLNTSIPFGSVDMGSVALGMTSAGSDSVYLAMDNNTNFAVIAAAKQAGINLKVVVAATGYGQTLLDDPSAVSTGQGAYFVTAGAPIELNTAATRQFKSALAKYEGFTGIPGFDWYEGWQDADLVIRGLQAAGKNPTRQSFIDNLHKVTGWDAGGLLPAPVDFSLAHFGKAAPQTCGWYVTLRGTRFVPVPANGKPVCGNLIPNSDVNP